LGRGFIPPTSTDAAFVLASFGVGDNASLLPPKRYDDTRIDRQLILLGVPDLLRQETLAWLNS